MTHVLLTGATGLIGGELMLELAALGHASTAVVRAADDTQARARLIQRLQKSVRFKPEYTSLVNAVAGEVTVPQFGVSDAVLQSADVVLHSAASTSFKTDANVYPTNLAAAESFANILKKLSTSQRGFFVGTAAVTTSVNGSIGGEKTHVIEEDMPFAGYANDYIRSKRDAETLLKNAGSPFVSLRPGIVLSGGIDDPKLARNMLWSIPVMSELGAVPLEPHSTVDLSPVDFVARMFAQLLVKPDLRFDCYHVATGTASLTLDATSLALSAQLPGIKRIEMRGAGFRPEFEFLRQRWMFESLSPYLPFLNANAVFSTQRLQQELGVMAHAPKPQSYLAQMLQGFSLSDAVRQMHMP